MTKAAAPIEHVRSDVPPPITSAEAAAFQDACATAAATHSARARRDRARRQVAGRSCGRGGRLRADAAGRRSPPLSTRRFRPPRTRRRRLLSVGILGPSSARRAVAATGLSSTRTAWPAAASQRGDNHRGGVLYPSLVSQIGAIMPTERGDGTRPAVLYALGFILRTSSGRIYPYSTFRRWLGQAGFEDSSRNDLPGPFPFTLITATRR
jgi:hypothetical protein